MFEDLKRSPHVNADAIHYLILIQALCEQSNGVIENLEKAENLLDELNKNNLQFDLSNYNRIIEVL
eukprot:Pgem_evm1s12759